MVAMPKAAGTLVGGGGKGNRRTASQPDPFWYTAKTRLLGPPLVNDNSKKHVVPPRRSDPVAHRNTSNGPMPHRVRIAKAGRRAPAAEPRPPRALVRPPSPSLDPARTRVLALPRASPA